MVLLSLYTSFARLFKTLHDYPFSEANILSLLFQITHSCNHPKYFRETRRVVGSFYYDSISGWTDTPLLFVTRVVDKTKNRLETFCFYTNQVCTIAWWWSVIRGHRDAAHHTSHKQ
jgi:hypothetical protein